VLAPDIGRLRRVPNAFLHQLRTQVKRLPQDAFPDEERLLLAFQRLRQAGEAGFDAKVIDDAMATALSGDLDAGKRFLRGEVHQRFAARRAHVSTPAGQAQLGGFIEQVMQTPPAPERVAQLKRLVMASDLVERTVIVTWDATALWAKLARPHLPHPLDDEPVLTAQQQREQRAAFKARIQRAALVELDFVFRDLGDDDLQAELNFWTSIAGQQTKDALNRGVLDALQAALRTADSWLKAHPVQTPPVQTPPTQTPPTQTPPTQTPTMQTTPSPASESATTPPPSPATAGDPPATPTPTDG